MCPQDACTIGQKIASITILLIFSAMAFQWFPHDTSTRAQKVNKNAWSDQMLLCLAPAFFVAWGSHPRPVWGFTCLAGARKNDFLSFFDVFYWWNIWHCIDTLLLFNICFLGAISNFATGFQKVNVSQNKMSKGCLYIPIYKDWHFLCIFSNALWWY